MAEERVTLFTRAFLPATGSGNRREMCLNALALRNEITKLAITPHLQSPMKVSRMVIHQFRLMWFLQEQVTGH